MSKDRYIVIFIYNIYRLHVCNRQRVIIMTYSLDQIKWRLRMIHISRHRHIKEGDERLPLHRDIGPVIAWLQQRVFPSIHVVERYQSLRG